jgi:hypothetical protein
MVRMPNSVREEILGRARNAGFQEEVRADGQDLYHKLITLVSPHYPSAVKIDKVTGFTKSGEMKYLKVAVHPEHYRVDLEGLDGAVLAAINGRTHKNLHSHSGFRGFGYVERNYEPVGKAYKINNIPVLETLLMRLSDRS